MTNEEKVIQANRKLLIHGDDTRVNCIEHNCSARFGDLDYITQLAVLNGWDVKGPVCIMTPRKSGKLRRK